MTISYADIEEAEKAQSDVIRKTSLTFSQTFSNMTGSQVSVSYTHLTLPTKA